MDGTDGAKAKVMVDTLISLKIILLLLLGILVLDEMFLGIQTAETVNFASARAHTVGLSPSRSEKFFSKAIMKYMIFSKNNPFIRSNQIQTLHHDKKFSTSLEWISPFQAPIQYQTITDELVHP